jgi:uncharacterized protein (DUF433 family)
VESYVEERDSGLFVRGTRVSLDSIIYEYRRGRSPESILQSFPLVGSLVRVYGAITYYLEHQAELEEYLGSQNRRWVELRQQHALPAGLKAKLDAARAEMGTPRK